MTTEMHLLLKAQDAIFTGGDKSALCLARSALSRGIKATKRNYATKIQENLRGHRIYQEYVAGIPSADRA